MTVSGGKTTVWMDGTGQNGGLFEGHSFVPATARVAQPRVVVCFWLVAQQKSSRIELTHDRKSTSSDVDKFLMLSGP